MPERIPSPSTDPISIAVNIATFLDTIGVDIPIIGDIPGIGDIFDIGGGGHHKGTLTGMNVPENLRGFGITNRGTQSFSRYRYLGGATGILTTRQRAITDNVYVPVMTMLKELGLGGSQLYKDLKGVRSKIAGTSPQGAINKQQQLLSMLSATVDAYGINIKKGTSRIHGEREQFLEDNPKMKEGLEAKIERERLKQFYGDPTNYKPDPDLETNFMNEFWSGIQEGKKPNFKLPPLTGLASLFTPRFDESGNLSKVQMAQPRLGLDSVASISGLSSGASPSQQQLSSQSGLLPRRQAIASEMRLTPPDLNQELVQFPLHNIGGKPSKGLL